MQNLDVLIQKRRLLNQQERIRHSVSKRIQRFPDIIVNNDNKFKHLDVLTILQRQEILISLSDHTKCSGKYLNLKINDDKSIIPEVDEIVSRINILDKQQLDSRKNEYEMFSHNPNDIISERCSNIDLNKIWKLDENFGNALYIDPLFNQWVSEVIKRCEKRKRTIPNLTILDWYNFIENEFSIPKSTSLSIKLLQELSEYLSTFLSRLTMIPVQDIKRKIKIETSTYCWGCHKNFSNENVSKHHYKSPKHITNLKKNKDKYVNESLIFYCLTNLTYQLQQAKQRTEREMAQTADERSTERAELIKKSLEPIWDSSKKISKTDTDKKDNDHNIIDGNLVTGPDGKTMPRWLWKLQGLNKSYPCEVCGTTFQGKNPFERHFNSEKHRVRLQCLGVDPAAARGLSKVSEVLEFRQAL